MDVSWEWNALYVVMLSGRNFGAHRVSDQTIIREKKAAVNSSAFLGTRCSRLGRIVQRADAAVSRCCFPERRGMLYYFRNGAFKIKAPPYVNYKFKKKK